MMFDLSGMTALVTGASGGLGSAIARALAAQGARLAMSGSNVEKLERFRAELGGDHVAVAANLGRKRSTGWSLLRSRRSAASSTSSSTMPGSPATTC
jgi:NAD(P)-dependent dehydrogenase (short-subunit alcohol dehydrogenase family)